VFWITDGASGGAKKDIANVRVELLPQLFTPATLRVPLPGGAKLIEVPVPERTPSPVNDHM